MFSRLRGLAYRLLRKSERYTNTDMVYLAKGGSWLTLNKIIAAAAAFALSVSMANLLPKSAYGVYRYTLSLVAIFSIAALPGINTAMTLAVAKGFDGSIWKALKTKLLWSTLGFLGAGSAALYYFAQGNQTLGITVLIGAFSIPLLDGIVVYGILQGKKLFHLSAIYNSISQVIVTGAMIATLFATNNVVLVILAFYLSSSLTQLFFFFLTVRRCKENNRVDKTVIGYGKHLTAMNVLSTLVGHIDKIITWQLLGPAQLAVYAFALAPVTQLKGLLQPITSLALPKLATAKNADIQKTLPKKVGKLILFLLIPMGLYIVFAPYLFSIFFPQYLDAVGLSQLFAISLLFFPQRLLGSHIIAKAKKKILYIHKTAGPIIKLALFLLLIPPFQLWGAIIALHLAATIDGLMLYYFFRRV